jgi:uncharacterized protein (TIGR00299 family) protein
MTRLAYIDCVGGLAGDMLLAALLDAGADAELLQQLPSRLGLGSVVIKVSEVERSGVAALHVDVVPPDDPPPRTWRRMRELIESAELPDRVKERALGALSLLATAEAKLHRVSVDDVHFHEIGGVDTLVDVCGAALLLDELSVSRVECSPLPYSRGLVRAAHGVLPVPAPATVEVLRGAQLKGVDHEGELVTPTGAALAVGLAEQFGPPPLLTLDAVGYGAGTSDPPDRPNVVRVLIGVSEVARAAVSLVEANIDDLNPELVPDAAERCFSEGALDVWVTPAQMKKGRPGVVLAVLCRPADETRIAGVLLRETSSLGVRFSRLDRLELDREHREVRLAGGTVRIKVGILNGEVVNVAPEHDDCAALARETGQPVKAIWAQALAAADMSERG